MDKEIIERIALETAKEFDAEYSEATMDAESVEFFTLFLSRIDAERGKSATAWLHDITHNDDPRQHDEALAFAPDAFPMDGCGLFTSVGSKPLFLSPTIPEGMALAPELSTSAMDIAGMEAVGIEGFGKAEAELCYIAMLAAAQGERNADKS